MTDTQAAETASKTFDLPAFETVDVATGLKAVITPGSAQSVRLESSSRAKLKRIKLEVVDGELRARHDGNLLHAILTGGIFNLSRLALGATVHVTLPELKGASAATGAVIDIDAVETAHFTVEASTGARLTLSGVKSETVSIDVATGSRVRIVGACEALTVNASSGGGLSAIELAATQLTIKAASGSKVEATATTRASGHVSSGAEVFLNGRPGAIDIKTTSGGVLSVS